MRSGQLRCVERPDPVAGPGGDERRPRRSRHLSHYSRWLDGPWDVSMRDEDFGVTRDGLQRQLATVPAAALDQRLEACRSGARVTSVGARLVTHDRIGRAGVVPQRLGLMIIRDLTLKGIVVGSRRMMVDMVRARGQYDTSPIVDRVYGFGQANEALAHFAQGGKVGKVVIRIGPDA